MTTRTTHPPIVDSEEKPRYVREMFARIARRYDLMNMLMTAGQDRHWRRQTIKAARSPELGEPDWRTGIGLDLASGTGDLAIDLARRSGLAEVVAIDLTLEMLLVAQRKVEREPLIQLSVADALCLPFPDDTFVCATVGFGVRNFADLPQAFTEMRRVLKPGGRVACLELSRSPNALFNIVFDLYFDHIVPTIGGIIAGDSSAYTYLPSSVKAFPPAPQLAEIMRSAGLRDVKYRRFGLGTVALHIGTK